MEDFFPFKYRPIYISLFRNLAVKVDEIDFESCYISKLVWLNAKRRYLDCVVIKNISLTLYGLIANTR